MPPANDTLAAALPLTGGSGSVSVDVTAATAETGEPDPIGGAFTETVWFSWTAPATDLAQFDTTGSDDGRGNPLDTVLAVYRGPASSPTFAGLTLLDVNDDWVGFASLVRAPVTAGDVLYIQAGAYGGGGGTVRLNYTHATVTAPGNDHIANATPLTGTSITQSTVLATSDTGEPQPMSGMGATVWFTWTPVSYIGTVQFSITDSDFVPAWAVYTGPPNAGYADLTLQGFSHSLPISQPYDSSRDSTQIIYVQLGGSNGESGTLTLTYPDPAVRVLGDAIAAAAPILGETDVYYGSQPPDTGGLSGNASVGANPPVDIAVSLTGQLQVLNVPAADPAEDGAPTIDFDYASGVSAGNLRQRTLPQVWLTMPAPVLVDGKPVVPAHRGLIGSFGTLQEGPDHIHAIRNPNPVWDGSGYAYPPPSGPPWTSRWTVDDLPDPNGFTGGYYWLGTPSGYDGTTGIRTGATEWRANSDKGGPAWQSVFPFKPSVRSYNSYLPGGARVYHPKGVNFNPHYIEHMWLDFGSDQGQPFTWVVAGMITSFPDRHYVHHILDAGMSASAIGAGSYSVSDCNRSNDVNDNLPYRNLLGYGGDGEWISTRSVSAGYGGRLRARADIALRPRMFFAVFNGSHSAVGAKGPGTDRVARGTVDSDVTWHKHYVLGRSQNLLSQYAASHMLLFELRYWRGHALSTDELEAQYKQLSATYSFGKYRAV